MSDVDLKNSKPLNDALLETLGTDPNSPERGGFVLDDGTLLELPNRSDTPTEGAMLDIPDDQLHLITRAVATWHTHPGTTANLSVGDHETFVSWPALKHAIVGTDGVRWYGVKNGAVINAA